MEARPPMIREFEISDAESKEDAVVAGKKIATTFVDDPANISVINTLGPYRKSMFSTCQSKSKSRKEKGKRSCSE